MTVTWPGPTSNFASIKNNNFIKLSIISKRLSIHDDNCRLEGQQIEHFTCQTPNQNKIEMQTGAAEKSDYVFKCDAHRNLTSVPKGLLESTS